MSVPDIHKNQVGCSLVVAFKDETGTVIDISAATTMEIYLVKPGGTVLTKTGEFETDGTDGLLRYVTTKTGSPAVYDLDTVGDWEIQGFAVIGTEEMPTKVNTFYVARNLF